MGPIPPSVEAGGTLHVTLLRWLFVFVLGRGWGMAFRRRRDEWDEFLKRHGAELRACGLPDYVVADRMRFLVFLDHGYDDWGRVENPHAFFDARLLTDEQISRLA